MRYSIVAASLLLAPAFGSAQAPHAAPSPAPLSGALALQEAFAEVSSKAKPAVVNISTVHEEQIARRIPHFFFGDPDDIFPLPPGHPRTFKMEGNGSGFIVDPKGYVLTNEHVIRNAAEIKVTRTLPDGKSVSYKGKVVGRDRGLDLAVVKIDAKEAFPYLRFAAPDAPRVGDWAIAIGSPFALEQTVTAGIVSAVRQSLYIEGRRYSGMIQTDAAINRGNSGGPLLNIRGEVIGVNTAIFSPTGASAGIGFAIAVSEVQPILDELIAGRKVRRGWMGLEAGPVDDVIQRRFGLPSAEGALVNSVFPGSPADKAGVLRGDVIVKLDGKPIADPGALAATASRLEPGKRAPVELYRDGKTLTLHIRLAERPEWADGGPGRPRGGGDQPEPSPEEHGATVSWEGVEFTRGREGVEVLSVKPDSRLAGFLMPGDIVRGIGETPVRSLADVRAATKKVKLGEGLFLDLVRRGQPMYLSVKP